MTEPLANSRSGLTGGSLLARNAYINLAGQLVPIAVAVFAIPLLIKVLGVDRFGVLTLAWVVMGYFGLFDLGLGRATTKFVAEHFERRELAAVPTLVWTSVLVHVGLGLTGGILLAVLTPLLVGEVLNVPASLAPEIRTSFYLLAISVPLVVITSAPRGVLEAIQRFDLVNLIKIPASIANYLGPLAVLFFVRSLVAVIAFLVISRLIVMLAHFLVCLRALPELSKEFNLDLARVWPLVGFGGWLTVSSFVTPSIVSIDRFVIGALISVGAVSYYATPYEVVSKLTIFSASLLAVLFPAFSAMARSRPRDFRRLYERAFKYLLVLVAPTAGVLLALATEFLALWVAPDFAARSAPVAKWLAFGVLINVLAQVPFTALQGVGRADVTAKLQLLLMPFYFFGVWYLVSLMGVVGAAVAWAIRAVIEAVLFFAVAERLLPRPESEREWRFLGKLLPACAFFLSFVVADWALSGQLAIKLAVVGVLLVSCVAWEWFFYLDATDRKAFAKGVEPLLRRVKR